MKNETDGEMNLGISQVVDLIYKHSQAPHIPELLKRNFIEEIVTKSYIQGKLDSLNEFRGVSHEIITYPLYKLEGEIEYRISEIELNKLISETQKINT